MKRLQIHQLDRIQLRLNDQPEEYPAQILDLSPATIVVRVPEELARLENPWRVRLILGQKNYAWEADAMVMATYEDWWFIRRPPEDAFDTAQRRDSVRILYKEDMIAIPVDTHGLPTGDPQAIKIRNLSATGCFGFMYEQFKHGDHVMVVLSLPELPIVSVIARVVRVQKKVELGGWYALVFQTLAPREKEKLARFIHGQIQLNLRQGLDITVT